MSSFATSEHSAIQVRKCVLAHTGQRIMAITQVTQVIPGGKGVALLAAC